jgi:glycosyltransferase involved in cell wall biosynthesis
MTLHDFKPWCTNRNFHAGGAPCERCRGGRHWNALAARCIHGSRLKSAVGAIEAYAHDWIDAYKPVALWIAPSIFARERALRLGVPPNQVRLLRHAVAPAQSKRSYLEQKPGTPKRFVLFAGRLSSEKGAQLLPSIADALNDTRVIVAGDGPLRAELERAALRQDNLEVRGQVSDHELAELRQSSELVIVPSIAAESFCYVAAEAAVDGKPVVAFRAGGIPELIDHEVNGLLVDPGDLQGFIASVQRVLVAPEVWRQNPAPREELQRLLSPAAHLAGLLEAYRLVTS